jgi:thiosulfate dehydrogenase
MGKFVMGLIVGLAVIPVAVYGYFAFGSAPVATSAPPMPFERRLAHMALHARLEKEMPKSAPITADDAIYAAGAQIYKDHCAVCHGLPGQPMTAIAKGMFPKPPKLMEGRGVTDDPAGETYWKVAGGIRMTGMPGFASSLSTMQMWQGQLNAGQRRQTAQAGDGRLRCIRCDYQRQRCEEIARPVCVL